MKITVIGAGSWGTTLANLLAEKQENVELWAFEREVAEQINRERRNELFLPGIGLCEGLRATNDLEAAVKEAEVVVTVCPSHVLRPLLSSMVPAFSPEVIIVNASKGLEPGTLLRLSQVIGEVLPRSLADRLATLSGPSFAFEVARHRPTVITAAALSEATAGFVQQLFSTPYFRVYKNDDLVGVELGGALKNVIAIATGMVEGAGLGVNTRAALITRGLAEISRLGSVLGARPATFSGISGLGDLVLTCTGELSRNRSVGLRIGQGETLKEISAGSRTVAEGIRTTEAAYRLSLRHAVEMPIVEQVYRILFEGQSLKKAIAELMNRELKKEHE